MKWLFIRNKIVVRQNLVKIDVCESSDAVRFQFRIVDFNFELFLFTFAGVTRIICQKITNILKKSDNNFNIMNV